MRPEAKEQRDTGMFGRIVELLEYARAIAYPTMMAKYRPVILIGYDESRLLREDPIFMELVMSSYTEEAVSGKPMLITGAEVVETRKAKELRIAWVPK